MSDSCKPCTCFARMTGECLCGAWDEDDVTADLAAQVQDLTDALDAALERRIGDEKLIDVMRRRYGREARQWQANHDERKKERNFLRAENDALREHVSRLEFMQQLHGTVDRGNDRSWSNLVAENNALRAQVEQLTEQRDLWKQEFDDLCKQRIELIAEALDARSLRQRVEQLTKERDEARQAVAAWTPEHEVSRWRALVADLARTRETYGLDHKRVWDCVDTLIDALDGFDGEMLERVLEDAREQQP